MIRRLRETDRAAVTALLAGAPEFNLYLMGNLVKLGFDQEFCEYWGDDAGGDLRAVINRYFSGWTLYGRADADWPALVAVLDNSPMAAQRLQDNPGGIPSVLGLLRRYTAATVNVEELMQLPAADFHPAAAPRGVEVRRATPDDLPDLVAHYADAGDMSRSATAVERPLRDTRIWIARVDGALASAALTNAETTAAAMIGGVFTRPDYRSRGIGQAVVSALSAELMQDGLRPVLYWQNAAAGAIYRKLGFQRIGDWRSVHLAPRDG